MVLEFRAMVSFTLEGVLHHAAGSWQTSKKSAQRDAAQRVLWLGMDQWSSYSAEGGAATTFNDMKVNGEANAERALELVAALLPSAPGVQQKPLQWRFAACDKGSKNFQAVAEFEIFGVHHTFPGGFCRSKAAAKQDCARRVLWYLKCPGYDTDFVVTSDSLMASEAPPLPSESEWQRDSNSATEANVNNDARRLIADQKTLLMRVQNRLQKAYVHQLPSGASVWDWSYEFSADAKDKLCRAWVKIHIANKEFKGDWCKGQKKGTV